MAPAFLRTWLVGALLFVVVACAAPRPQVEEPTALQSPPVEFRRGEAALLTPPPPVVERAVTVVAERGMETIKPTPAPFEVGIGGGGMRPEPLALVSPLPMPVAAFTDERMVIKNAEFDLTVADALATVDRLAALATAHGGYVLSSQVREEVGYHYATVQFAVLAERFEAALEQVRRLALQVNREDVTGQDVSQEFVDLQARLRNLEATADRIRSFLDQAKTADEALKINKQLSEVEEQIEQLKARIRFLERRATYSLITVFVREEQPTPTPTPTSTPTPTVTPTPTPTPIPAWQPNQTARAAVGRLQLVLQALADAAIWFVFFWLPLLLPAALLVGIVVWLAQRYRRSQSAPPPPTSGEGSSP